MPKRGATADEKSGCRNMTQIKVCGLRPGDDLGFTSSPIVSHIGVVFVPQSKRYVNPMDVPAMLRGIDPRTRTMGVFANLGVEDVLQVLKTSGIRGVQLHGSESPTVCQRLKAEGYEVWKALRVDQPNEVSAATLLEQSVAYADAVDGLLYDAAPPKHVDPAVTGGHGAIFEWSILASLSRSSDLRRHLSLWVAGGLTPENVGDLLRVLEPDGVDVSSGVERQGRKDSRQISAFIEAVKQGDQAFSLSN